MLKFVKNTSQKIRFELEAFDGIEDYLPFDLELSTGYKETDVEHSTIFPHVITFPETITIDSETENNPVIENSVYKIISDTYLTTNIFDSESFGWVKSKIKTIQHPTEGNNNSITISSITRDCTTNIKLELTEDNLEMNRIKSLNVVTHNIV